MCYIQYIYIYIFLSRKSSIGLSNLGSVYFDQQVTRMDGIRTESS